MNLYNVGDKVFSISLEVVITVEGILGANIVDSVCSKDAMEEMQRKDPSWRKRVLYLYKPSNNAPLKMIPESDLIREESLLLQNE